MRTAIYARVSTDEQAAHGTSLEEQVRLCRQLAADPQSAQTFIDAGESGTTMERPHLRALMEGVRRHEIDQVLVYDPDRLSRNVTHLLLIVDELRRHGVELVFVNFQADLSPDGRLLFTVRGAISEFEAYRIKQRMYAGKQARARANQVAAGTCIYGYRLNRATKQWEEEPAEAQVVRLIFEWATECGTWEITRRLNERGVPARFGGTWSQSSVLGILRNRTYLGSMPQMSGLGAVPVPPLVAEEQAERVRHALGGRSNRPKLVHPYLLTGRLRCGVCGRAMCGGYGRPTKSGTTTYYGCTSKAKPKPTRCTNSLWRSDELDAAVWSQSLAALADPEAIGAVAQEAEGRDEARWERERAAIAEAGLRLERERQRIVRAFRRGVIAEEDLARQQRELQAEADVLALRSRSVGVGVAPALVWTEELLAGIVAESAVVDATESRRAVLSALGVEVRAGPGDLVQVKLGSHSVS